MMSVTTKLHLLQDYLDSSFPGCLLMPCSSNKIPKYAHKDGQWTSASARAAIPECNDVGALLLLNKDLIVIDVDEEEWVDKVEILFPMLLDTVSCKTKKGKHYYVKWTPECDDVGITDSIRKMKAIDDNGNMMTVPIDIKTITRTGTKSVIAIPPSPNKVWTLGKELGLYEPIPMPELFLSYYKYSLSDHTPRNTIRKNSKRDGGCHFASFVDDDEVSALVNILSTERADNYDDWMRVGWCLHNIDSSNACLSKWKSFSRKCTNKYDESVCDALWFKMSNVGLGIGSLHMWAKYDNAYEYNVVMNKRFFNEILEYNGTHHAMALLAKKLLKGVYVCANTYHKIWYNFDGTLWKQDVGGLHARGELSESVRRHFLLAESKLKSQLTIDDLQSDTSKTSSADSIQQKCDKIGRFAMQLQNGPFKDHVLKDMNLCM